MSVSNHAILCRIRIQSALCETGGVFYNGKPVRHDGYSDPISTHLLLHRCSILGKYRGGLIQTLEGLKEALIWCGDGRFDSVGHSAKYGAYTMYCSTISKIVHFEVLQVGVVFSVLFLAYFLSLMHILYCVTLYYFMLYFVLLSCVVLAVLLRRVRAQCVMM